jgi:phospholipid/cholesterol/gamma-HCH transport system substrate-binding protein
VITRRTKIQLVIFVVITLVGVSYVGARYARLDRVFFDDTYTVVAQFDDSSGGIYAGAEVSYRGVRVGQVDRLEVTREGVDVYLDVDKDYDEIPAEAQALVGNRSALGEQYVELQPLTKEGPYLEENSRITRTAVPIPTSKLLKDIQTTVSSVDQDALRTTVKEMGLAFKGTGEDLGQIIDTSNAFIETANENFDVTTALIRDSNTVLRGQIASEGAIRSFTQNLALFTGTVATSDKDIRRLISSGSATANVLRRFLEENQVEIGDLINNLVTTGEIMVKRLDQSEMILVMYPWVVEGGFTVTHKNPATGLHDAHFGMVMTSTPHVCRGGYEDTRKRPASNGENWPMEMDARCTEPASVSNARGGQHAPRRAPVATYDSQTGKVVWADEPGFTAGSSSTVAPKSFGEESWKWLLLQPLAEAQE